MTLNVSLMVCLPYVYLCEICVSVSIGWTYVCWYHDYTILQCTTIPIPSYHDVWCSTLFSWSSYRVSLHVSRWSDLSGAELPVFSSKTSLVLNLRIPEKWKFFLVNPIQLLDELGDYSIAFRRTDHYSTGHQCYPIV